MGLDKQIERLQNMASFNIFSVSPSGDIAPWFEVAGVGVVSELVINEQNLAEQVQIVSAQIAQWGRYSAQCQRVLEIEERHYRAWRSQVYLDCRSGKRTVEGMEKRLSQADIEAVYRVDPQYAEFQNRIERAKEAHEAVKEIVNAFKAKRDMLRVAVWRASDGSVQMSV